MIQSGFLIDLLATITQRTGPRPQPHDRRSLKELCTLLLSEPGDMSSNKVSRALLSKYASLDEAGKRGFFAMLATEFDIDAAAVEALAASYARSRDAATLSRLTATAEPLRQEVLRRLNRVTGATAELVAMRCDLLRAMKEDPALAIIDLDFLHLFRSWFNQGFLVLRRIDWHTPASILEKIIAYEAVHAIDDWDELRLRLLPPDRRCYAYFHPCMPDEPLIFVEVALTRGVADNIQAVLAPERSPTAPEEADTAVFYSISNCQIGLRGISFGNSLIKQVVEDLLSSLPDLRCFVTLSPVPGFRRWAEATLGTLPEPEAGALRDALAAADQADGNEKEAETLRYFVARYLLTETHARGGALDPVGRFHLGNGALLHDIHPRADLSLNGLRQSGGAMVNYLYDIGQIDRNIEGYATRGTVAHSRPMASLLRSTAPAKTTT